MKGLHIRPDQTGLRVALFDLEADVMEVVWSKGWDRFAVSDVHRALSEDRDIAYTTVMTTVTRLFKKGLLDREKDGKRWDYRPRMSREAFNVVLAQEVFARLAGDRGDLAATLLTEHVDQADEGELERLERAIRARRRTLKR